MRNNYIYTAAIGIRIDNTIIDISIKSGTKNEIIEFLNKEYMLKYLRNLRKNNIVINLCYNEDYELDDWLTIEEFNELGGITLK